MAKKFKGWVCKGRGGIVEIWNTKYPPVKCFDNGRREWYWVASSKEGEGLDGWRWPMEFKDDIYPSISCDDKPKPIEISITIKEKKTKLTQQSKSKYHATNSIGQRTRTDRPRVGENKPQTQPTL